MQRSCYLSKCFSYNNGDILESKLPPWVLNKSKANIWRIYSILKLKMPIFERFFPETPQRRLHDKLFHIQFS